LDAQVQARVQAGTPFAVLIREALLAYLADTPPTAALTAADSADSLRHVQAQLAALTARVAALEQAPTVPGRTPTPRRHHADRSADRALTAADRSADTAPTPADTRADSALTGADGGADSPPTGADTPAPRRGGRPSSPLRQQILALLQAHPEGLRAEEIRVYAQARRPIGDLLAGMVRGGVLMAQGRGALRRYVLSPAFAPQASAQAQR
jgi:hypothetical protein